MVTSSSCAATGAGVAPRDRKATGRVAITVTGRTTPPSSPGNVRHCARRWPSPLVLPHRAGRSRRSPPDTDRQVHRRPDARPHASHPRWRHECGRGGGCRHRARPRPGTRHCRRALHRGGVNLTLAELWRLIARAAGGPSERSGSLRGRCGGRARRCGSCLGDRGNTGHPARGRAHGPAHDVLVEREGDRELGYRPSSAARGHRARRALVSRARLCRLKPRSMPSARWAWRLGVRRRAPHLRVVQVGIGGRPPIGLRGIVISAGLCGGLPEQTPGTVVIPTQVVDELGVTHACDPGVVSALETAARYLRLPVTGGSLISTSGMVTGAERATWADRGHIAVDMEFAAAAESAQRFGVIRVILDTPSHELSAAWAEPARAIRQPANWSDAIWLGSTRPATHCGSARCYRRPSSAISPRGIAAPPRGASARHPARRSPSPSRAAPRVARGGPPRRSGIRPR